KEHAPGSGWRAYPLPAASDERRIVSLCPFWICLSTIPQMASHSTEESRATTKNRIDSSMASYLGLAASSVGNSTPARCQFNCSSANVDAYRCPASISARRLGVRYSISAAFSREGADAQIFRKERALALDSRSSALSISATPLSDMPAPPQLGFVVIFQSHRATFPEVQPR